jgi:hypothetical protein
MRAIAAPTPYGGESRRSGSESSTAFYPVAEQRPCERLTQGIIISSDCQ